MSNQFSFSPKLLSKFDFNEQDEEMSSYVMIFPEIKTENIQLRKKKNGVQTR